MRYTRAHRTPNLSRRHFLKLSATAGLVSAFRSGLTRGATDTLAADETLIERRIPASGEHLPVIGLGTARTMNVDPENAAALADLRAVMKTVYARGGRVVDSSPMYGTAESVVGDIARELAIADDLFMATKVWTRGAEQGVEQMEESRARMGGGRLELIQVHNLVDLQTHLITLRQWREAGRVKYIGVTHSSVSAHDELARIVAQGSVDFVQFNYNIAERNAAERLLPLAADNGVATLINEPFERGTLFSRVQGHSVPQWAREELGTETWAQYFLKYIVGHPAVTCAIPATSDPEHAADNMGAAHGAVPNARQRQRMLKEFQRL